MTARTLRAHPAVLAALGGTALALLAALPATAAPAPAAALVTPGISGDYLEARTADVYTGSCFANSEVDLAGKQAVVAWHVRRGAWQGVRLDGLAVVAAVRTATTLGDPFGGPLDAAALLVVDRRATPAQRDALVAFAHAMSGDLLSRVVGVESATIEMALDPPAKSPERADQPAAPGGAVAGHGAHHHLAAGVAGEEVSGGARLKAGDWIDVATRGIGPQDHLCGNEEVYYPPLAAGRSQVAAVPAVTVAYDFRGPGLGMVWSSPGKRSAFVGHFSR
jgi:Protein of unknown function (DUF1326)